MNKRHFLHAALASSAIVATGCASDTPFDRGAKRGKIDSEVRLAMSRLREKSIGTRELVATAKAILVFPSVWSAGLVVGASHGDGVLLIGPNTAGYYSTTSASIGLTAGAQTKSIFILFLTDDALRRFQAADGWTAGVDASINVLTVGATGTLDTQTIRSPVVGLVLSDDGLMADLSLEGAKVTRLGL